MIKGTTQMSSAIDVKTEDIINNIKINDDLPTYGHMLNPFTTKLYTPIIPGVNLSYLPMFTLFSL